RLYLWRCVDFETLLRTFPFPDTALTWLRCAYARSAHGYFELLSQIYVLCWQFIQIDQYLLYEHQR
ncbi:hypothetical protein NB537_10675, partial [Vibrio parahaemolyticus]